MDALIDTGFTGFVQLPERRAQDLGLTPGAVAEVEYADGRTGTIPLAWARVSLGRDAREELIHIQRGNEEVIVGVELLRIFRKILVLSIADRLVMLVDTFDDLPSR